jgi:hypothetical protein
MSCNCIERGEQDPDCAEHGIVPTQRRQIENLTQALYAKQAKIDALMLEFCPGEMSAEQRADWAKHQRASNQEGA